MSIKTLLYVAVALAVCYGLLKAAWTVSESVMKPEDQEISQPVPVRPTVPEPKLQTGTAAGGVDSSESAPAGKDEASAPATGTDDKGGKDATQDGYYDDGVQSAPGTVKPQRSDTKDPYAPDGQAATDEEGTAFPSDDREEDRSQPVKSDSLTVDPEAYAPDPHEVD